MKKISQLSIFIVAFLMLLPALAWAQGGVVQDIINKERSSTTHQQEQERMKREELQGQAPDVLSGDAEKKEGIRYPEGESPCVPIYEISMVGDEVDKFNWALSAAGNARGLCLGSKGIGQVMANVQNAIIAKGYLTTRISVEPQDLRSGHLILTVVPGRINELRMADDASADYVLRNANLDSNFPTGTGKILNLRDLEQGLENLRRVPSASANIEIVPGQKPGESDVVVNWQQERPIRFGVSIDDAGQASTGRYQAWGTVFLDNLLGMSDLLSITVNSDMLFSNEKNSRNVSAYYSVPIGYYLLSVAFSDYRYRQTIIIPKIGDYEYRGKGNNLLVELSRVIYRTAASKTWVALAAFKNKSRNYFDEYTLVSQGRDLSGWEAAIGHRHYFDKFVLDSEFRYHRGTGAFGSRVHGAEYGYGVARPSIFRYNITAYAPFTIGSRRLNYQTQVRGQFSENHLTSIDRFIIGGRYSVRGYTGDQALSGDNGVVWRNDLGMYLGNTQHQVYLGADFGWVWGQQTFDVPGNFLSGVALGLKGELGNNVNYDLFVSAPISRPNNFDTEDFVAGFNVGFDF